jgi:hypothetical protein
VLFRFTEERLGLLWREWLTRRIVRQYIEQRPAKRCALGYMTPGQLAISAARSVVLNKWDQLYATEGCRFESCKLRFHSWPFFTPFQRIAAILTTPSRGCHRDRMGQKRTGLDSRALRFALRFSARHQVHGSPVFSSDGAPAGPGRRLPHMVRRAALCRIRQ